jgi:class 3 adenylate cyclase
LVDNWGKGNTIEYFSPSVRANPALRRLMATYERAAASPAMARALIDGVLGIDVRAVLPSIHVPTLVINRKDEQAAPASMARAMAEAIPGAELLILPGIDHNPWVGDYAAITSAVAQFLTGRDVQPRQDRILTTLLFTDIVGSTERAAAMSDAVWRDVLDAHNRIVRDALSRYRGIEVNTTGDGFLARFDGPARAIECAVTIRDAVTPMGVDIRAGVHTGEVEILGDDITGTAVNLAARVCAASAASEITVTSTVKDLVIGAPIEFVDRGHRMLKGVPGEWQLFAVSGEPTASDLTHADTTKHLTRLDRTMIRLAKGAPSVSRLISRAIGAPR